MEGGKAVADVMRIHHMYKGAALEKCVYSLLDMVGLPSWLAKRYPELQDQGDGHLVACHATG